MELAAQVGRAVAARDRVGAEPAAQDCVRNAVVGVALQQPRSVADYVAAAVLGRHRQLRKHADRAAAGVVILRLEVGRHVVLFLQVIEELIEAHVLLGRAALRDGSGADVHVPVSHHEGPGEDLGLDEAEVAGPFGTVVLRLRRLDFGQQHGVARPHLSRLEEAAIDGATRARCAYERLRGMDLTRDPHVIAAVRALDVAGSHDGVAQHLGPILLSQVE